MRTRFFSRKRWPIGKATQNRSVPRADLEPVAEGFRLRHHREIELAVQEEFREAPGDAFDQRHLATRMHGVETRRESS